MGPLYQDPCRGRNDRARRGNSVECGTAAIPARRAIREVGKNAPEARLTAMASPLAGKINVRLRECRRRVFSAPLERDCPTFHTQTEPASLCTTSTRRSRQRRPSLVPLGRLFVGVRQCEDCRLCEVIAADLKPDWQPRRREATWHRDRRQTVDIEGRRIHKSAAWPWARPSPSAGWRRRNRLRHAALRGRDEQIDCAEHLPDLAAHDVHLPARLGVGRRAGLRLLPESGCASQPGTAPASW